MRSDKTEISKDKGLAIRVWNWVFWLLAFFPAIVQLSNILSRRLPVPYQDSWGFMDQYQKWCEGHYSWGDLFAPHNVHPSAPGKLVYFAVLQFLRGDVSLLPLLSWSLSFVISLGVLALSRSLWRGKSWQGAGLMLLANLSIFTPTQGVAWIWDFVFQKLFSRHLSGAGLFSVKRSADFLVALGERGVTCAVLSIFFWHGIRGRFSFVACSCHGSGRPEHQVAAVTELGLAVVLRHGGLGGFKRFWAG